MADHLSRIERVFEDSPIRDDFSDDHLYILYSISDSFATPWFANILILWGLSLSLLVLFIFSLLLIMFQNGWTPNPPELTMLRFLWILLDLICFAGLESLEPSLVIKAPIFVTDPCMPCSKSMGSCT